MKAREIPRELLREWGVRGRTEEELTSLVRAFQRIRPLDPLPKSVHQLEEVVLLA